jgi:hypothetical protein
LATFGVLSSVAIALNVTPSDFVTPVHGQAYPTKADFDWTFSQFMSASPADTESTAADREKIRMDGLRQMNLGIFGEE